MKRLLSVICCLLSAVCLMAGRLPRLGQSSDRAVIAAMTLEEKVQLLVGTCKDWNLVPEAAPATIHRPPVPDGYWDTYQGNTASMKGKVSGAAGVSYAIPRLGIPSIVLADGPVGLRIDSVCTAFPSTALLAALGDTALIYQVGRAIGEEMLYYGVDILLAPGINIMRNPLCGRNYEYMSSDPAIAGRTASAYVRGVQSMGVGACVKHFAVNNQETYRNGVDAQLSDELLRGLYLRAFEQVVREAQPWTLMSSYNKINGVYAAENRYLLTDILRGEWGFQGFVMTDWWAEEDPIRMQLAGNDMLMPGTQLQIDTLIAAVRSGRLDEQVLDRNLENILRIIRLTPSFRQQGAINPNNENLQDMLSRHAALSREVAAKGMVVLKNNGILPLTTSNAKHQTRDSAPNAAPLHQTAALLGKGSYDTYAGGTGSGGVTRAYKVLLSDALTESGYLLDTAVAHRYQAHVALSHSVQPKENAWFMPYVSELEWSDADLTRMAHDNDICILTLQRMAGEGGDRHLTEGDYYLTSVERDLILRASRAFHAEGKRLVLVLNMGSSVELTDVCDAADAILMAWLPGQEAGHAIVDALTGRVEPQGKLPMPFYVRYEDVPSATNFPQSDGDPNKVIYREGFAQPARVLYPVGHGLRYSDPLPYYPQQEAWLREAETLRPTLRHTRLTPVRLVTPVQDDAAFQGWRYRESALSLDSLYRRPLAPGQVFTFDMGRHAVGYLTLHTRTLRRCQDGPIRLRVLVGEMPAEMNTPLEPWGAWLSRGWIQDEMIHITDVDQPIRIARRMAGRYVRVEVLGASQDFDCALTGVEWDAVSTVGEPKAKPALSLTPAMADIYRVGLATLGECMQTVYEDGPKRDRRLWIGDLYLQSLANRYSFRHFDLTKRCLYLFAALASEDGTLISNIFEQPTPHPQVGSYMLTYSMLFNSTLKEYFLDTQDRATAEALWPVAKRQIEDALTYVDEDGLFDPTKREVWLFFDWREGLDVTAMIQSATIFALDETYALAKMLGREAEVSHYPAMAKRMREAARRTYFDSARGVIVSGADRQVSVLSQTWAVKSGVLTPKQGQRAIRTALSDPAALQPGTPYATHYLIDAMLLCGMHNEARSYLLRYWGGMVERGADTFWEAYDPTNDYLSPYDFFPVNSACHAWSCTPVYFIGKYPKIFK